MSFLSRVASGGFLSRVAAGAFGPSQSVGDPGNWLLRAMGARTAAGVAVNEHRAMTMAAVYCAVGLVASNMAQLPCGVFRKTKGGYEQDFSLPLSDLMRFKPNPFINSYSWVETKQHHVLLWGNGYTEIQRNGKGEALGLWPLLPDKTHPVVDSQEAGLEYRTSIDGQAFKIQANDVLHMKAIGYDGYVGYSPLFMARQAVGLGLAMEEFGAKFFANDAKSGGFLMHPGRLGPSGKKNLQESMGKEGQGGLDNAHRVKILEEGTKFVATMIPPEDAQYLGSRSFQVEEISRIYRIPLILMNSHEKMSVVGSSAEQLLQFFILLTLQPWIVQWEREMNYKLFTKKQRDAGFMIRFNLDALQRGDMAARSAYAKALFECGALSPDEIRRLEGMNVIGSPGSQATYVPINFQPVDRAIAPPAPGEQTAPVRTATRPANQGSAPAEDTAND